MANMQHLKILDKGVKDWNEWRKNNPEIIPDLREANLKGKSLWIVNFREAELLKANLSETDFLGADLQGANLVEAYIEKINICKANFKGSNVYSVKYRKLGKCMGVDLNGCTGSPRFIRDSKDNEFLEEYHENHKILWAIWSVTSDCGRSIWRWIIWSMIFALYFAGLFHLLGKEGHFKAGLPFNGITEIYYSVVTFTTLGFGDVTPLSKIAMIDVSLEVILGYIMLGGLISIMATKLARRAA